MGEPLKRFFDRARVEAIAERFRAVWAEFPVSFVDDASRDLEGLELMDRGRAIADALARALPREPRAAMALILRSLGPEHPVTGAGLAPFQYLPDTMYVAKYALDFPDEALDAMYVLTRRLSCEFAIRPFLARWPERTFARLRVWCDDPEPKVRRLVSEGTRPRLPWAARVPALLRDPSPALPLLERLRDDPSADVRRSVANHLNDIGKDFPERLVAVARAWLADADDDRRALVRHALRDRVKKGDADCIALLGAGGGAFEVRGDLPATAALGGTLPVVVHVRNVGATSARAVVDLAVGFPGRGAATRKRVFKVAVVELDPGESVTLRKSVSLRAHTTRAAIAGPHTLAAQIDGRRTPLGEVLVR